MSTLQEFDNSASRFRDLLEVLQLNRRDLYSRLNRKADPSPEARDLFRAGRERRQRHNRHRLNTLDGKVARPRKMLSTTFRHR